MNFNLCLLFLILFGFNSTLGVEEEQLSNVCNESDNEIDNDYEAFARITWDTEFNSSNCFFPIIQDEEVEATTVAVVKRKVDLRRGLHLCTLRPCNCWIGSCFAYCVWGLCFNTNSMEGDRMFLECDPKIKVYSCNYFAWPCSKIC